MSRRARSRRGLAPRAGRHAAALPKSAGKNASQRQEVLKDALMLLQQGRPGEAETICNAVLTADPRNAEALHLCGIIKHQQGRYVDALRLVGAALNAKPAAADVLTNYGVILDALARHAEALASFDRVLAMQAGDAIVHYNRGNALKGLGRHAEALASYDRALVLRPENVATICNCTVCPPLCSWGAVRAGSDRDCPAAGR